MVDKYYNDNLISGASIRDGKGKRIDTYYAKNTDLATKQDLLTSLNAGTNITISDKEEVVVPEEYTQLEYIQSSGTQYIDTGVPGINGITTETKIVITSSSSNQSFIGARQPNRFFCAFVSSGSWDNCVSSDSYGSSVEMGVQYTVKFVTNSSGWSSYINNELNKTGTDVITSNSNLYLFARSNSTVDFYGYCKMYYTKIWDATNTLIRNFIPAKRNSDNVVGMYDTVTNTFYENGGTGVFAAGDLLSDVLKISAKDTTYTAGTGLTLSGTQFSANITNSVTSTATNSALSANMGKELQDQIDNLKARGRYLSQWNCTTGLAATEPTSYPYDYKAGDYFIVGTVGETNYKPDGSQYTGTASTVVETAEVAVEDVYYYDGATWHLQQNTQKTVSFANLAGQPTDNANLATALNAKQDVITDLETIRSGAALGATALQSIPDEYITETELEEYHDDTKQDALTETNAGKNITITQGSSESVLPSDYIELKYIEGTGTQYILTGLVLSEEKDTIVTIKAVFPNGTDYGSMGSLFGAQNGDSRTFSTWNNQMYCGSGANRISYYISDTSSVQTISGEYTASTKMLNVLVNGASQNEPKVQAGNFSTNEFALFYVNGGSGITMFKGRCYNATITVDGELVRNFVPAKNSYNAIGLYDTVEGTFYTNKGTGGFIAGEEIGGVLKISATVPTKTSELTNDSGYITSDYHDSTKQDTISDLETIRSNAEAGKEASDTIAGYGNIVTHNTSEFATAAQGTLADSSIQPKDNVSELTNDAGYITGITSSDVTTALGYTPYNSTNPDGYVTSAYHDSTKQDTLISGTTIKTINNQSLLGEGNITIQGGTGTSDYNALENLPQINSITLAGDKSLADLGIQAAGDYATNTDLAKKQDVITNLSTIESNAAAGKAASDTIATYGDIVTHNSNEYYLATNPEGYTSNKGTVTGATMNGASVTVTDGILSLGTVITSLNGYATESFVTSQGYITKDVSDLTNYTLTSNLGDLALKDKVTNSDIDGTIEQDKVTNLPTTLAGKQDTLTAGTNIKIEDNTISVTGELGTQVTFVDWSQS